MSNTMVSAGQLKPGDVIIFGARGYVIILDLQPVRPGEARMTYRYLGDTQEYNLPVIGIQQFEKVTAVDVIS